MTTDEFDTTCNALNDILERERASLLEGRLTQLVPLLDQKQALIDGLIGAVTEARRPALECLQERIGRNQGLLNHALAGLRSVSSRLAQLHHVRGTLETYDARGAKLDLSLAVPNKFEKRT